MTADAFAEVQRQARAPCRAQAQSQARGCMKQPPRRSGSLDEARLRQQAIGARLRQIFDDVVNEPVPDEFLDILRDADARDAGKDR